ncbi:MAG: glycosyltransferase, partial [Candidatus Helarchaeota archaeon]
WCDNFGEGGFRDFYQYRLDYLYRNIGLPLRRLMDFIEKDLRLKSHGITVISEFLLQRAINMGVERKKIFLIRGSVDVDKIKPIRKEIAREKIGINKDHKVLVFLGSYQGDLDIALMAFALVLQDMPNIHFLIIGKKDENVRKKAAKLRIINKIIQTGWCSEKQLPWLLSVADAFLLPMRNNSLNQARWPNKIGEYMAASRPTICTRVGEMAKLIEEEEIGLVSEVDFEDFAKKILFLLKNEELSMRMGKKARKIAENKFALNVQGSKIESVYKTLFKKTYDLRTA